MRGSAGNMPGYHRQNVFRHSSLETISKWGLRGLSLLCRGPAGSLPVWGSTITGSNEPVG